MRGRPVVKRSRSFRTVAALTLLPVGAVILFFGYRFVRDRLFDVARVSSPAPSRVSAAVAKKAAGASTPATMPAGTPAPHGERGSIVLIIDDVGFEGQRIDRAMELDPSVNFAVLPNGSEAQRWAETLHRGGFEILCHLPMEPEDPGISPGRGAVLTSMSDDEIAAATRSNVAAVRYARGVNNHMGSRATADRRVMEDVLRALPAGMYFIDSRTGGRSVAMAVARELKVRTAARRVFLDDVQTEAAVRRQLASLAAAAKRNGTAIGIGHPHPVTLRVLAQEVPRLRDEGFRFVRASEAVR